MPDSRRLSTPALIEAMRAAREATLNASLDLTDEQWRVPQSEFIQPTAWDLTHIGWFWEFWLLRGPHRLDHSGVQQAARAPQWFGPDEYFDSSCIEHFVRWRIALPTRAQLRERLQLQLEAAQGVIRRRSDDADTRYFAQLSLFHELMHVEALAWTRQACGYPAPAGVSMPRVAAAEQLAVPHGTVELGTDPRTAFAFDNETPRREVGHGAFSIDSHLVRNDAFRAFVEDDGYARPELWPEHGLPADARRMPVYWRRAPGGGIEHRRFDHWLPLPDDEPVVHVNAHEAEAYCRWAGRRLPTATEWHAAATGTDMQWGGSVWEWTADTFSPYPCFRPGPYVTYSAPWFHHQRELRGGSYTTHRLLQDHRYRNFFLPSRTDVFAGFRTAATS